MLKRVGIRRSFIETYGPEAKEIVVEQIPLTKVQAEYYRQFHDQAVLELDEYLLTGDTGGFSSFAVVRFLINPHQLKIPLTRDSKGRVLTWKLVRS